MESEKKQWLEYYKSKGVIDELTFFDVLKSQLHGARAKYLVFDMSELKLDAEYTSIYSSSKRLLPFFNVEKIRYLAMVCQTRKTTLMACLIKLKFEKQGVVCRLFYGYDKAKDWLTAINEKEERLG
ncbi:hypothetical protein [Carboxylicivirga sp. RSCT41]|uniref:hypothetical protein n=1 Tax=Carboxylicivirga agarovorans TaxID=3417570 RepID=UPI003D336AAE